MERVADPTVVAALLSLIFTVRNKLQVLGIVRSFLLFFCYPLLITMSVCRWFLRTHFWIRRHSPEPSLLFKRPNPTARPIRTHITSSIPSPHKILLLPTLQPLLYPAVPPLFPLPT